MASIPLRAYNREIENMIDTGQVEEAAAHSIHILKTIPKHLGTYRLLGKAMLENQHYSDAADVFQRVLSSAPDDFIANLGMSIIREDEGNIEAAIWHMERAFETQPANAAIQEELRRLYGKRDGMEPPKVRLTRGALARMYARGHLYVQSIAELRAALSEDPLRPDLQVLLAEMYHLAGQRVECVDVCSALLKKFPYCLKANLLLAIILPDTERAQDTQVYRQRVISLDPYFVKAKPTALTTEEVPDNAVNIERLDIKPGQFTSGAPTSQPSWAATLGIAFNESGREELPEWLEAAEDSALTTAGEKSASSVPPFEGLEDGSLDWDETATAGAPVWLASDAEAGAALPGQPAEETAQEDAIPEWMKEAGWGESTGEGQEVAFPFEEEQEAGAVEEGEIEKGDIPDWLRGMAPSGVLEDENLEGVELDENLLPWLDEVNPAPGQEKVEEPPETEQIEDLQGVALSEEAEEVADWLKDLETSAEPAAPGSEGSLDWLEESKQEQAVPEWLKESETPEIEQAEEPPISQAPEEAAEELPAWLSEVSDDSAAEPGELPDWLKETEVEAEMSAETQASEDLPEWLRQEEEAGTPAGTAAAVGLAAAASKEVIDWLHQEEKQAGEEPAEAEALKDAGLTEQETAGMEVQAEAPVESQAEPAEQVSAEPETAGMPDLNDTDAAMAWLESLAAKQGVPEEQLTLTRKPAVELAPPEEPEVEAELAGEAVEEKPEWLQQIEAEEQAAETQIQAEAQTAEEAPPEAVPDLEVKAQAEAPAMPDLDDTEAAMAWLESLAAKQGVPEEQLALTHTPSPEFEVEIAQEGEAGEPEAETAPISEPVEEKPEWLRQIEAEEDAAEVKAQLPVDTEAAVPEEKGPPEEKLEWLRELEAEEEELAETTQEAPVEIAAEAPPEAEAAQPSTESDETEAAMAWLESLAARQGAPQDQLTTRPEDRSEIAPEWVLEQARAAEESAEPPLEEAEAEPEAPGLIQPEPQAEAEAPLETPAERPETMPEEAPPEVVEEEIPAWMRLEEEEEEGWIPPETTPALIRLDLNQASLAQLEELPGIGFVRAQSIVAYRETYGPFTSLDDLQKVSGLGPEIIGELQDLVTIPTPTAPKVSVKVEQPQPKDEDEARLFEGRSLLLEGNLPEAVSRYSRLIQDGSYLAEVIQDLQEAVFSHPVEIDLWQLLGDAYMQNDQLQDSLDAYTRAEQLLR